MNEAIPAMSLKSREAQDYTIENGGFGMSVYVITTLSMTNA
jgi:hypothetical protein